MLSTKGAMTYLKDRRAVLVHDSPTVIEKVENFINQADSKRENIRITVDYVGSEETDSKEFGVKSKNWGVVIEDGKVKLPKIDGINATNKSSSISNNNQMQLVTVSGSAASLWVGKEIPEVSSIRSYLVQPKVRLRRHGKIVVFSSVDFEMHQVGAKLKMRPTAHEDGTITVELFPEISYYKKDGKRDVLQIESLSTKVVILPKQRISIGSIVSQKKADYKSLFGPDFFKSEAGDKILKMYLTAEII